MLYFLLMAAWIGPAITGGTSILSNFFGKGGNEWQQAMAQQAAYQREFARHGIKWRVLDAQEAGIHPLYALGASTHSPTFSIGAGGGGRSRGGDALAAAGRSAGMAYAAHAQRKLHKLQVQRAELENALLASQIKRSEIQSNAQQDAQEIGSVMGRLDRTPQAVAVRGNTIPETGDILGPDIDQLITGGFLKMYRDLVRGPAETRKMLAMYCQRYPQRCREARLQKRRSLRRGLRLPTGGLGY